MDTFLTPWEEVEPDDLALADELARETTKGHTLHGIPTRAIGRRQDCDDILFELRDGTGRVAVVHLTWAEETDPRWPFAKVYPDIGSWGRERMTPDHQEWAEVEEGKG